MLGKRTRPVIGKLSALLVSGNRTGFLDVGSSPRGPLDLKIQSPRAGLRCHDIGVVGLGIVAAMENQSSDSCGHETLVAKFALCSSKNTNSSLTKSSISSPIPVSGRNCGRCFQDLKVVVDDDDDSLENYTYVTCHGSKNMNNFTTTRVYYDGGDETAVSTNTTSTIKESPAGFFEDVSDSSYYYYPTSDFLSSCHLCRKKLHGKDIYMYRGEKGFCSNECRSAQIMKDERKERCRADASRSVDVASSPYTRDQIFSTDILAI